MLRDKRKHLFPFELKARRAIIALIIDEDKNEFFGGFFFYKSLYAAN